MNSRLFCWLFFGICFLPFHLNAQGNGKLVDYTTIGSGHSDFYESEHRVYKIVDSMEELVDVWINLYGRLLPIPKVPDIDFEKEIVIFLLSERGNSGYKSKIENIEIIEYPAYISIFYVEIIPGPGCTNRNNRSYRMIRIPNMKKSIKFANTQQKSKGCFSTIH